MSTLSAVCKYCDREIMKNEESTIFEGLYYHLECLDALLTLIEEEEENIFF